MRPNPSCRKCDAEYTRDYRIKNPVKVAEYRKKYFKENPNYSTEWKKANAKRVRCLARERYKARREIILERKRKVRRETPRDLSDLYVGRRNRRRAYYDKTQATCISAFYRNRIKGSTVDHIIPLINDNVCGLHAIQNLQYLSSSENSIKAASFDGTYDNNGWRKYL
jgi:hypothetical protein